MQPIISARNVVHFGFLVENVGGGGFSGSFCFYFAHWIAACGCLAKKIVNMYQFLCIPKVVPSSVLLHLNMAKRVCLWKNLHPSREFVSYFALVCQNRLYIICR